MVDKHGDVALGGGMASFGIIQESLGLLNTGLNTIVVILGIYLMVLRIKKAKQDKKELTKKGE